MISKEIKQLIELSGGKVIISEGSLEDSYVVVRLGEYLKEIEKVLTKKEKNKENKGNMAEGLTNEQYLDRINTDIATLHSEESEEETIKDFELEDKGIKYESVH